MGRSRREKAVALTATRKHVVGRESKQELLNEMRNLIDKYENIFVFRTENMRNVKLKELRSQWKDSRFYFGRKKIVQVAFGRTEGEAYAEGLHEVAKRLVGNVGILFTNRDMDRVRMFFEKYVAPDFARSGFKATSKVELSEGPLDMFVPEFEPRLRELGLNVTLQKGVVMLREDFCVCDEGDVLTPERAKILEYLGVKMAEFRVKLECSYTKDNGLSDV